MKKVTGAFFMCLSVLLILGVIYAVLTSILPSIYFLAAVETGAAYHWGRLAGGVVISVLLVLLACKSFLAARRRLSSASTSSATNA